MTKGSEQLRSSYMQSIEDHSRWILDSAAKVEHYVNQLAYKPPYETKAYDQIQQAQARLAQALSAIGCAIEAYKGLEEKDGRNSNSV